MHVPASFYFIQLLRRQISSLADQVINSLNNLIPLDQDILTGLLFQTDALAVVPFITVQGT